MFGLSATMPETCSGQQPERVHSSQAAGAQLSACLRGTAPCRVSTLQLCKIEAQPYAKVGKSLPTLRSNGTNIIIAGCIIYEVQRPSVCHVLRVQLVKHSIE